MTKEDLSDPKQRSSEAVLKGDIVPSYITGNWSGPLQRTSGQGKACEGR